MGRRASRARAVGGVQNRVASVCTVRHGSGHAGDHPVAPLAKTPLGANQLFYGDNLDILRSKVRDETVDLCYIDPPFNSKRTYNQIYNNVGKEDLAQEQAFVDTWTWDDHAREGLQEIISNSTGGYTVPTIELIKGLRNVLGEGNLLAYLVSMTRRIVEIYRILKPTGSFYLHCDPTSSHYLKLVVDGIFCGQKGDFRNEIIWLRSKNPKGSQFDMKRFSPFTDTILFYAKSEATVVYLDRIRIPLSPEEWADKYPCKDEHGPYADGPILRSDSMGVRPNLVYKYKGFTPGPAGWRVRREVLKEIDRKGNLAWTRTGAVRRKLRPDDIEKGQPIGSFWGDIPPINSQAQERLGWPTQKPEALLARIIEVSSNKGDLVLDAYCGCGTSVAVAERLGRSWIGMDITYQSIALILKRLEDTFGKAVAEAVVLDGVPRDMASATALAHKKDDRVRKEFEKWAVLTYSMNRATVNSKKGADGGIDGTAYFWKTKEDTDKAVFQVKSGNVGRGDVAKLKGDMERERAAVGVLITLDEATQPMRAEAKAAGLYMNAFTSQKVDRVQIVSVREIIEKGTRLSLPLTVEVLKAAVVAADVEQSDFVLEPATMVKTRKMVKASLPLGFRESKPAKRKRRA